MSAQRKMMTAQMMMKTRRGICDKMASAAGASAITPKVVSMKYKHRSKRKSKKTHKKKCELRLKQEHTDQEDEEEAEGDEGQIATLSALNDEALADIEREEASSDEQHEQEDDEAQDLTGNRQHGRSKD